MNDVSSKTAEAICEIRDLLRLIAEPQIAARDKALREKLAAIVGRSAPKRKSVLSMDGSHTQAEICREAGIQNSNLSTLVKQLKQAGLVDGDTRQPRLTISIPAGLLEEGG